jgi:hypothetical protein
MLTKKDFINIGNILKQIEGLNDYEINLFIDYFKKENPLFNEEKFKAFLNK